MIIFSRIVIYICIHIPCRNVLLTSHTVNALGKTRENEFFCETILVDCVYQGRMGVVCIKKLVSVYGVQQNILAIFEIFKPICTVHFKSPFGLCRSKSTSYTFIAYGGQNINKMSNLKNKHMFGMPRSDNDSVKSHNFLI